MHKYKVLITSVSGAFGAKNIEFMKSAYKNNVWVLGVDMHHDYVAEKYADKFELVPSGSSDQYIDKIINLIDIYNINIILPCSDEEAISLSRNRSLLEKKNVILATANISAMNIMSNKIKTYNKFKKLGISVPDFVVVNNYDELINQTKIFNKNSGSFVIKEPVARGNRGTLLVDENINGIKDYHGSRELHMGWDHYNNNFIKNSNFNFPLIVTERMFEPAYDIDVLAKNGKVIHAIPRERINPAGVPYKGNILRNNKDLFNLAEKVTQVLKLSWLYDLDIMTKKNGEPAVLEVNPRPSGSSVASMEYGVPLYKDLLKLSSSNTFNSFKNIEDGTIISPSLICNVIKK